MIELEERPRVATPRPPVAPPFPAAPLRRRRRRPWLLLAGALLLLLVGLALAGRTWLQSAPRVEPVAVPATPKLVARGEVHPIGQARVGTLTGGVVRELSVQVGDVVGEQQAIGRVRGADGAIEVLTAPWRGTVTGLPVHEGDTVLPGATVATLGDLTRLQVETTDVDEFVIGYLYRGQVVTMTVDALDRLELRGYVRTIALQVEKDENGDEYYPVVVDLAGSTTGLRPGMTVRLEFAPPGP